MNAPAQDSRDLMPLAEAARALGVSEATARRWFDNGRLSGERIGRVRYPYAEAVRVLVCALTIDEPVQ